MTLAQAPTACPRSRLGYAFRMSKPLTPALPTTEVLRVRKAVVGMIHVGALPGTPRAREPLDAIIARAVHEAEVYAKAGLQAVLLENMHDVPYLSGGVGPEITAAMTAIGVTVRQAAPLPVGVQILAGANHEALAVAHAIGGAFVRVENFVYAQVADEGLMPRAAAGPLLRYRRQLGADNILIIADVDKKHASHTVTDDLGIEELVEAADFFGADGVVVTGRKTGQPADLEHLEAARGATELPLWIGSGVTKDNLAKLWSHADVFVVGSHFKKDGHWAAELDPARVAAFMDAFGRLRARSGKH